MLELEMGLEIGNLDKYDDKELKDICQKLQMENIAKCKGMAMKKREILKLYESVSSGSSPCHTTGNGKRASGGW